MLTTAILYISYALKFTIIYIARYHENYAAKLSCSESVIDELKPLLKWLSQHWRERFNVLQNNVIWEGKGLKVRLEGGHLHSEEEGALELHCIHFPLMYHTDSLQTLATMQSRVSSGIQYCIPDEARDGRNVAFKDWVIVGVLDHPKKNLYNQNSASLITFMTMYQRARFHLLIPTWLIKCWLR